MHACLLNFTILGREYLYINNITFIYILVIIAVYTPIHRTFCRLDIIYAAVVGRFLAAESCSAGDTAGTRTRYIL